MEVCQVENEWPTSEIPPKEQGANRSHCCKGCHLVSAVPHVIYRIWLISDTTIVESEYVCHIGVNSGIGVVSRYVCWNSLVLQTLNLNPKWSIRQTQESTIVDNKGANPWQGDPTEG